MTKGKERKLFCAFSCSSGCNQHTSSARPLAFLHQRHLRKAQLTFSKTMLESFPDYIFSSLIYTSEDNANQGGSESGETSSDPAWFINSGCIILTWKTMLGSQASRKHPCLLVGYQIWADNVLAQHKCISASMIHLQNMQYAGCSEVG